MFGTSSEIAYSAEANWDFFLTVTIVAVMLAIGINFPALAVGAIVGMVAYALLGIGAAITDNTANRRH